MSFPSHITLLFTLLLWLGGSEVLGQAVDFRIIRDDDWNIKEIVRDMHEIALDTFLLVTEFGDNNFYTYETEVFKYSPGGNPELLFVYSIPGSDHLKSSSLSLDSNYLYLLNNTIHNTPTGGFRMVIGKVDMAGNVLWQHIFDRGFDAWGEEVVTLTNGNILVGGRTGDVGTLYNWWLTCFDPEGNLLWERNWIRPELELIESISFGLDGVILIGGVTADTTNANSFGPTILAIDQDGNALWSFQEEDIDVQSPGFFGSITADSEGNIYAHVLASNDKLYKFSPDGNVIWKKEGLNSGFVDIDRDGNIIYGGQYAVSSPAGIIIRKYSPDGDLLSENSYYKPFHLGKTDMILCSDGGIAFCGGVPDTSTTALRGDAMFVKFNCEGQFIAHANSCVRVPEFEYPQVDNLLIQNDLLTAPLLSLPEGLSAVIELYDLVGRQITVWGGVSDRNTGIV